MRTLVLGDPIVHLGDEDVIPDGALVIEDGKVVDVGPRTKFEGGTFDETLGSPGHFVIPGFINCHFHCECALGQGVYEFIFERANIWMHNLLLSMTEEDLYNSVMVHLMSPSAAARRRRSTCTTATRACPHFGADVVLHAYEDVGLRVAFGMVNRDQNRYVHQSDEAFRSCLPSRLAEELAASPMGYTWPAEEVFDTYRDLVGRWDRRDDRIRVILAPDWTPACSDELYRRNRRLADEYATGITTHALETRSEMTFNFEHYGKCALERLRRPRRARRGRQPGALRLGHRRRHRPARRDRERLVERRRLEPAAELRHLARARHPRSRRKAGFGTDAISFGDREDFFDELRLAALLQRRPMELESGRLSSSKLLRSAATSGARAVRFEKELGSLTPGKDADLLILRKDHVFWPPARYAPSDPLDVIIDRADQSDIEMVVVRGRPVLRDGRITTVDERAIRERYAEAAANRLWRFADPRERRWALELPAEVEPYVLDFYRRWTDMPTDTGYSYNTTTGPVRS